MIPEAAVEAAAKAIFAQQYDPDQWTNVVTGTRDRCKRDARAALEAAAPRLMSSAWEEGRQAEEDAGPLMRSTPNPYDATEAAEASHETKRRGGEVSGRVEEIEARLKAATPGPWESMTEETPDGENIYYTVSQSAAKEFDHLVEVVSSGMQGRVDAEFIAHGPEDIAYLLAELKNLRSGS